ncbi:hypothetical protein Slala03_53540 [Streptomyces lavendulae subsp. lavendulae]|uniref:hypothetical protein n=1 Tax=Streptomyces lavendulae TaxID=1914 RepID=UPI0024A4C2C9|nr:hypothetical protein [Streptomyces lavendulae]GLV85665.1 hypothetical protein Slala03_53540 [Streptomyces lavendulae subsp. lavendulae]
MKRSAVQAACGTRSQALNTLYGAQFDLALAAVVRMRRSLYPCRGRGGTASAHLQVAREEVRGWPP